jgi:cellulose synthase/poly-beta-1,6-N-acetylglucosamine synthase-like glycosyltransferase
MVCVAAVAVYAFFFMLFARFFWWKRLAWRDHFGRRPQLTVGSLRALARERGQELPRFTILIPARNEAPVIGKTLDHMSRLDYPATHYEVLVITDGKEPAEAAASRRAAVAEVMSALGRTATAAGERIRPRDADPGPMGQEARLLLLHLLSTQAVREYGASRARQTGLVVPAGLGWLRRERRIALLREIASLLVAGRGRVSRARLMFCIERLANGKASEHLTREANALLGLAIPVVAAYADLAGGADRRLLPTMLRQVARAGHRVTEEIIAAMARMIGGRLIRSLGQDAADDEALQRQLESASVEALPTTQDIIHDRIAARSSAAAPIRHVVVPADYDGEFRGRCTGNPVPSTKGRALNYALSFVDPRTDVCGFYDAESRPDLLTLMYVAWRRLVAPGKSRVLQGPVFQVRNLFHMSPLCKIAALYQAVSHEWYLPQLFRRLPFVGGTNLYVERELIYELGGYDHHILTEDLELGVRAYVQAGVWPEYLPYASSEQTPPTFRGFFRQRLRWGTGHLQVMDKLRRDEDCDEGRRRQMLHHLLLKGQVEWGLYQMATMVPPTVLLLHAAGYLDPNILPVPVRIALNVFTLMYFGFTFYIYTRYRGYVDMSAKPRNRLGDWSVVPQLVLLPFAAFMFPVPYSTALVLKGLGREPRLWVKTPRTAE